MIIIWRVVVGRLRSLSHCPSERGKTALRRGGEGRAMRITRIQPVITHGDFLPHPLSEKRLFFSAAASRVATTARRRGFNE